MSLFKRQNPFHQADVGAFNKPFSFGALFLFVVIYALISIGAPLVVGLVIPMFTGLSLVFMLIGLQVGIYWLCRQFHQRTGRSMTQKEYRWSFWRIFLSIAIFYAILGCLVALGWFAVQSQCHSQTIMASSICQGAFATAPIDVVIITGIIITLLINLCFIGFCLKRGLRGIISRQPDNSATT